MHKPAFSEKNNPYAAKQARYYALGLLTIVYSFNFIDRQLLAILQEAIKEDLLLSDGQLGLLTGFAFAVFYVTAGIPIARWADGSNRRNIVALALAVWSGMTALSGLVQNYWQLLLVRIGSANVKRSMTASSTPGSPTTMKATRQPKYSLSHPPNRKPKRMPKLTPIE